MELTEREISIKFHLRSLMLQKKIVFINPPEIQFTLLCYLFVFKNVPLINNISSIVVYVFKGRTCAYKFCKNEI